MNRQFKMKYFAVIAATLVSAGTAMTVNAATATATVQFVLGVTAPTCTVSSSAATVVLPVATSASMTQTQWRIANGITTASANGLTKRYTSSSLNQTATVGCNASAASILGFSVQPGPGASLYPGVAGLQYLIDETPSTAVKAADGNLAMEFEQVSINGAAAPFGYANASTVATYSTPFNTTNPVETTNPIGFSSTAIVVWRPVFYDSGTATALGNPTGGSYKGSAQIVVNY